MSDQLTLLSRRALEPSRLQPRRPSRYEAEGQPITTEEWQSSVEPASAPLAPVKGEGAASYERTAPLISATPLIAPSQQQQPATAQGDDQRGQPAVAALTEANATRQLKPERQTELPPVEGRRTPPPMAIQHDHQPAQAPAIATLAPLLVPVVAAGQPAPAPQLSRQELGPSLSPQPVPPTAAEAPPPTVVALPPLTPLVAPPVVVAADSAARAPATSMASEPQPPTVVEIHIGRIEFAAPSMASPPAQARPEPATPQVQSLDRYLAAREQGRGRS